MRDRVRGESLERYKVVKQGEFAYNPMRLNVGSIARWRGDGPVVVSPDYVVFRPIPDQLDSAFLDFARQSSTWSEFVKSAGAGSVRTRIYFKDLARYRLPLPPLPEQRKVAAILSSVDAVIERTEAVIEHLQVVKNAMMQELLTRGIPGRHSRFKQTEIGEIPEEWEVAKLGDVLEGIDAGWSPKCDGHPAAAGEWGVLKVSSVSWGRFDPCENKRLPDGLESRPDLEVRSGDLVISRANTPKLVGRAVVVGATPSKLMLSDKLLRLRVSSRSHSDFVNLVLASPSVRQKIEEGSTGTSKSMRNISQEKIRALSIPLPSLVEQHRIAHAVQSIDARVEAEDEALNFTRDVKASLMAVLLTGEVRVGVYEEAA